MENIIEIPEGYEARIESNKVILEPKEKTEEERIRKAIIKHFKVGTDYITFSGFSKEQIIAWLEKKGEKNERTKHPDMVANLKEYLANTPKEQLEKDWDELKHWNNLGPTVEEFLYGKQNTTGKVEPKFKVGDWVVLSSGSLSEILQIVRIDLTSNYYWFDDDSFLAIVDEDCLHLWTIKDAEDGDVFSCENGWTCIFKALDNRTNTFSSYCFMDKEGWFCECGGQGHTLDNRVCGEIYPATKEQRDLLFQKMQEDGYEWDAEKKELRKIGPKFKVGDWVVTENGKVNQVKTVSDDGDAYTLDDETYFSGSWKDMYHLWTIEDAKDGDVLANEYGSVFIYAGFEDDERVTADNYCYITANHDEFCIEDHKTGSWYYVKHLNPATKEQRDLLFQKMKEAGYEWDAEKKELNKIEPKFKVGNWYLCVKDFLGKGVRFDKGKAYHCGHDGCLQEFDSGAHICIDEKLYDYFRPWTIEDAKDGDVLVASDDSIFLLKGVVDNDCMCYIALSTDNTITLEDYWEVATAVHPATKGQRDLLFQKMKEAGYEWDAEKKELRKIEPKFKVGDTICPKGSMAEFTIESIDAENYYGKGWRLSISAEDDYELVEQNPAWGEEDEDMVDNIIKAIHHLLKENESWGFLEDCLEWLKALKERYTWKPTDAQMESLDLLSRGEGSRHIILRSLYNDLKKLKG